MRHNIMQQAITLPYPAITVPPAPALCPRCGVVRRAQETPVEQTWENALIMLAVAVVALTAGIMAAQWIAASGVLAWLG
jgi:hypothetical protein